MKEEFNLDAEALLEFMNHFHVGETDAEDTAAERALEAGASKKIALAPVNGKA